MAFRKLIYYTCRVIFMYFYIYGLPFSDTSRTLFLDMHMGIQAFLQFTRFPYWFHPYFHIQYNSSYWHIRIRQSQTLTTPKKKIPPIITTSQKPNEIIENESDTSNFHQSFTSRTAIIEFFNTIKLHRNFSTPPRPSTYYITISEYRYVPQTAASDGKQSEHTLVNGAR